MECEIWTSTDALRDAAKTWDDLWRRSDVALPTARALPTAIWHEHFHPRVPLKTIVVREGESLLAALPLVVRGRWPKIAQLPFNDWMPGGMLLVDANQATASVGDCLVDGLERLSCHGFWLRNVPWQSEAWNCLREALGRRRWPLCEHHLHDVGLVNLRREWSAIEAQFSGNHRRHMRKALRRAEREGGVDVVVLDTFQDDELEQNLRLGFEIEASGWKGHEGTGILSQPGMFEFVLRQARELNRDGQVRLIFLRFAGKPIAFEYCWKAKGQVFTPKIGYDEAHANLSPGQLLIHFHVRQLVESGQFDQIDFSGPLVDSTAKWATSIYSAGTLVFGKRGLIGQGLVKAYAWRRARKLRARQRQAESSQTESSAETPEVASPEVTDKVVGPEDTRSREGGSIEAGSIEGGSLAHK